MKKLFLISLTLVLILIFAACASSSDSGIKPADSTSETEEVNPYNEAIREGLDLYAVAECFVKTEYNQDGNPLTRRLYSIETLENVQTVYYRYNKDGVLCALSMDGKDIDKAYYKDARFTLSHNKGNKSHSGKPWYNNKAYDSITLTWNDSGILLSEIAKPNQSPHGMNYTYDTNGSIVQEKSVESGEAYTHRYLENGGIVIAKAGSSLEIMSLTIGENGMPKSLTCSDYTVEYSYNESGLCTLIQKVAGGKTLGKTAITYDEKGNVIKREVKIDADGKSVVTALYEYAFDEKGNMTKYTLSQADDAFVLEMIRDSVFSYGENNLLLEEIHSVFTTPGNVTSKKQETHRYDEAGNRVESVMLVTSPGGTTVRDKVVTRYDTDGNRISTIEYDFHTNWTLKETIETEYNQKGKAIKITTCTYWEGKKVDGKLVDGQPRGKKIVEKNETGEYNKKIYIAEYLKEGTLDSEQTTLYGDLGYKTSYVRVGYYSDGTVSKKETEQYHENSVQVKYKESFSFDKEGVLKGEGNYEYDLKGNPLKTYGMFYSQNEMQEETYEYTYFEDGQLKSRRQCWYTSKVITSGYYIEFNSSHECVTELKLRYENGKLSVKEEAVLENGRCIKIVFYYYDENGNEINREEKVNP